MKKRLSTAIVTIGFGVLSAIISGCATNRTDLVDEGIVSVETVPSERVKVLWTDVYQDGQDWVVYGVLHRRSQTSCPIRAHVDISILSADGTILEEARTEEIHVAGHVPGKGINWTPFQVRFPGSPPKNSNVRLVVHDGLHE
ncbi:MAG: hypothetical protein ACYTBJ_10225 [Planctomycetota bacterium]|jgi:hypothetical protein